MLWILLVQIIRYFLSNIGEIFTAKQMRQKELCQNKLKIELGINSNLKYYNVWEWWNNSSNYKNIF
jgi:hypothetical protein